MTENLLIGVDVGGTFTDAVVLDGQGNLLEAFKLPSTGTDPSEAVISALRRISEQHRISGASVCHGTTVGTNSLIERKGPPTALVTTSGFSDVIELRRQDRPTLYDLDVRVSQPLVDRGMRFEVDGRMDHKGRVLTDLPDESTLIDELKKSGAQAVAISCLHAYSNGEHEARLAEAILKAIPEIYVSLSHDVCPELGEYERTSTTVVNAFIGKPVSQYLHRLDNAVRDMRAAGLSIVKSNGGVTSTANAARYPVHLIESGPAACITAAVEFAKAAGRANLIAFDMGGTTAKAGVIMNGAPRITDEFRADQLSGGRNVGGYLIRSTVIDIVEIGAGGGSIACIDAGGVLKVGPGSAGAQPGPACYGRGGTLPTVTDAHAVIGTLTSHVFEATDVAFDRSAAVKAIEEHVAAPMGWSVSRAAFAIIDLAVAHMAEMVRLATVRRGLDPRDFSIFATGGAGPLHAAAVGAETGVRRTIIPPLPGMFSALGATLGEIRHDLSRSALKPASEIEPEMLVRAFDGLEAKALELIARDGGTGNPAFEHFADLRFVGQLFELRVALKEGDDAAAIETRFRAAYVEEFGFDLNDSDVQLVALHLTARLTRATDASNLFNALPDGEDTPIRHQKVFSRDGSEQDTPVFSGVHGSIEGPALIELAGSTVWLLDGQRARRGNGGAVEIETIIAEA
ncbi:hydantoinase/oxoprolinase family protein [Roseovarius pacificus]|uniref:hydantoinase/oxoprolinase family protein n=1 Tax=Roseovarius pacificus TaxID=337701 RepID=UPI002A18BF00|nr:hydantoinase/oxoprolinase family protein [Roseovarius pacificus]